MAERVYPIKIGSKMIAVVDKGDGTATVNIGGKIEYEIKEIDGVIRVVSTDMVSLPDTVFVELRQKPKSAVGKPRKSSELKQE